MNAAHAARVERLYQPTAHSIVEQLPAIGANLDASLKSLARDPSHARAGLAALQLNGALGLLRKLQEAIQREAAGGSNA